MEENPEIAVWGFRTPADRCMAAISVIIPQSLRELVAVV